MNNINSIFRERKTTSPRTPIANVFSMKKIFDEIKIASIEIPKKTQIKNIKIGTRLKIFTGKEFLTLKVIDFAYSVRSKKLMYETVLIKEPFNEIHGLRLNDEIYVEQHNIFQIIKRTKKS